MKWIVLIAIFFSILVLFYGYAFAFITGSSAPADEIGSYDSGSQKHDYSEMSHQERLDTIGKVYEIEEPADQYSDTYDE